MQQLVLTRGSVSIPWGFRLKGGSEYNVPLSILKVNDGSPAQNQLDIGDIVVSIGQYPALNLKHEEALNIIRLFDVTLPITIRRDSSKYTSSVWRPPSVSIEQQSISPINNNYDNNNYSAYAQQNNYEQQQQQEQEYQQQQQEFQQEIQQESVLVQSQESNNNNNGSNIPDALLKAMNGPPMSTKPFTYTPGGLDLSHIRESSRVKRYEQPAPAVEHFQRATTPSYHQQLQQWYIQNQYIQHQFNQQHQQQLQQQTFELQQQQQRYPNKFEYQSPGAFITAPRPRSPMNLDVNTANVITNYDDFLTPPESRYENKYAIKPVKSVAPKLVPSGGPPSAAPSGPPAPGFNIKPEQIIRHKQQKREDTNDLANQSYSFRMLNKWISDSESKTVPPMEMIKSDQQTITAQPTVLPVKRTDVLIAVEEEEKKQKKLQMLQSSRAKDSASNVPSKVFKFIDRKFSTDYVEYPSVNVVNGQPVDLSTQATPPTRYRGAEIPSKSFKQLQNMTRAAEASSSNNTFSNVPPQVRVAVAKEAVAPPADLEVSANEVQEVTATEVNNVQIEATYTQPACELVEQPVESFTSSANEITNEATVEAPSEITQSNLIEETEKPAEPQIETQIEDVVAIVENLNLTAVEEPTHVVEEPTPVVEEPPVPEPESVPVVEQPIEPEPVIQQEMPITTTTTEESQIESNSSEATNNVQSNEAQDKNEISDF